jgi:asparagine synthase (glutamine-hydrolysing)
MSGVFGFIQSRDGNSICEEVISRMAQRLKLFPWTTVDTFSDPDNQFGLGRIGISIFNPEPQPVSNEEGTIYLLMAGELYDPHSIRSILANKTQKFRDNSDAEIVLRVYQEMGPKFIASLEGIFIVAILDSTKNTLTLVNDRFGLYPCYYARNRAGFAFAPAVKPILDTGMVEKNLDLMSVAEYFRFQHLMGDKTFVEDIKLLPNAAVLSLDIKTGVFFIEPSWGFERLPEIRKDLTFDEAVEATGFLLREAIRKRAKKGPAPIGVYLSGGMDSRTILGLVDRNIWPTLHAFTFGHPDSRDIALASAVARKLSAIHHPMILYNGNWVKDYFDIHLRLTEGFHSWIHSHGISTFEYARDYIGINLSGLGGGWLMAGEDIDSRLYDPPDMLAWTSHMFYLYNQKNTWPSLTEAEEKQLYSPKLYHNCIKDRAFEALRMAAQEAEHFDPLRRTEYFIWQHNNRRLYHMFPVFYSAYIEMRYPFYDYPLVEFIFSLPLNYRQNYRLYRAVMQKELPRLATIPYDRDNLLPTTREFLREGHRLYNKTRNKLRRAVRFPIHEKKTLYADYEEYLRTDLNDWASEILFSPRTLDRGIFELKGLQSLFNRHQSGYEEWTIGKVAPLITFEMMLRYLLDDDSEESFRAENGLIQSLPHSS